MDNERIDRFIRAMGWVPTDRLRDQVRRGIEAAGLVPAEAQPVGDPGEFGVGIQPNPKARYWQERAEFWRAQAVALGWREKRDAANGETPPSAPVGVEGIAREAVALALDEAGCYTEANNVRRGIDLDEYRVELSAARIALAQQPAAEAQAVGEVFNTHPMMGSGYMHFFLNKERLPTGTKLYIGQPPSAPVGVEGLDTAAVEAGYTTFESMKQCADSWLAVVDALNTAAPDWCEKKGTGRECAVAAIAALAQQPAAVGDDHE